MRLLLAIFFSVTITTYASAGPFIRPENATASQPPTQPADPQKLLAAEPLAIAVKHCLTLEDSITRQYKLIDAFNTQPDLDNLPQNMSDAAREKVMLYVMGNPDIAGFGFLIPDLWHTTPRNLRLKWNALATLRLDETLGFKYGAYPFAGNCKGELLGKITHSNNFSHAQIQMPLAFDQTQAALTYMLSEQDGYNWQIDDLLVNGVGVENYLDKDLARNVAAKGLTAEMKLICQRSGFGGLRCY